MTVRVKVFAEYFNSKRPNYETNFIERKKRESLDLKKKHLLEKLSPRKQFSTSKKYQTIGYSNTRKVSKLGSDSNIGVQNVNLFLRS